MLASLLSITLLSFARAMPLAVWQSSIDPALVPEFGVEAGQNPDGTGNCAGINGILIPCTCPPQLDLFIADLAANVANGRAVNNSGSPDLAFPIGNDPDIVLSRLFASTVTLQNLFGPGVGCPQASTTFGAQIQAAQAQKDGQPAAQVAASTPADPPEPSAAVEASINVSLVPEFGTQPGQGPDGTGNCIGNKGVLIPCSCPPDRSLFIQDLQLNLANGRPVNNTGAAPISFPTGADKASVLARLNAATETLQNFFSAGFGCPQAATTFGDQVAAAQALPN